MTAALSLVGYEMVSIEVQQATGAPVHQYTQTVHVKEAPTATDSCPANSKRQTPDEKAASNAQRLRKLLEDDTYLEKCSYEDVMKVLSMIESAWLFMQSDRVTVPKKMYDDASSLMNKPMEVRMEACRVAWVSMKVCVVIIFLSLV